MVSNRLGEIVGSNEESWELIERLQAGEEEVFSQMVPKYQSQIFNICYRFLGDYEEAADLTQDTFIKAYKSIKKFRGDSAFFTWLYRIAVNLCKNRQRYHMRRKRGKTQSLNDPETLKEIDIPDTRSNPQILTERKELQRQIQEGIKALPDEYRPFIILRDIQGLSYKEIEKATDSSSGTIKSRLYRARRMLRNNLVKLKVLE